MTSHARPSQTAKSARLLTDALGGKKRERERWTGAAYLRILRKLNAEPTSPHVARVLWLLEALIKVENLRIHLYEPAADHLLVSDRRGLRWVSKSHPDQAPKYNPDEGVFIDPQLRALDLQFKSLLKEIEEKLKRYRWTPTVRCGDVRIGLGVNYIWPRKSEQDSWENWAVWWLIDHAARDSSGRSPGLILRFKHCLQCGVWFYASTEHQKHSSTRCRKKFHSESPEFRKKRANYMSKYRLKERAEETRSWEWSEKRGLKKRSVKREYL